MKLNLKIISLLLILCLFSIASVSAIEDTNITNENLQINSIEDNQIAINDSAESKTFTELYNLIDSAESGTTIELDSNYEYDEGFSPEGIIFNKTLTIDGKDHILDGKNTGRIFYINGENVVLKNIVFQNGYSNESVGAVGCRGDKLTIKNCTFINNYAHGTSSPVDTGVISGAVYISVNNGVV